MRRTVLEGAPSVGLAVSLLLTTCAAPAKPVAARDRLIHARPGVTFDGSTRSSGWLRSEHPHKAVIAGTVGGVAVQVLLDTGAGVTVIDRALVESVALELRGAIETVGVDGASNAVAIVSGLALRLGTLTLSDIPAIAMDLAAARRGDDPRPIVILGVQVYHELILDVDYPQRRVALRHPQAEPMPDGWRVPLRVLDDRRVAVALALPDGAPRDVLLDTGSDGGVYLFEPVAQDLGPIDTGNAAGAAVGGVGGSVAARRLTLPRIALADAWFTDVVCHMIPSPDQDMLRAGLVGLVGGRALGHGRWVLDCANGAAVLVR
ncbi:MAG: aspartyl protease family protein [Planctomycetota bacterium]